MAAAASRAMLPDGRRLHLHHGPIDLVIEAFGSGQAEAYECAWRRFEHLLEELAGELPGLRSPNPEDHGFQGTVAGRMAAAVAPYTDQFITPMAAVAGAVADEVLQSIEETGDIEKAYVNNGGDTAFFLSSGQSIRAAIAAPLAGRIEINSDYPFRGVATSGWAGRSQSLGISDAVSVVAHNAADADAAATLIANAVDLPGHAAVQRSPARELFPDSDLGDRLVTTGVGPLTPEDRARALNRGVEYAEELLARGLIAGAVLILNRDARHVGASAQITNLTGELSHA